MSTIKRAALENLGNRPTTPNKKRKRKALKSLDIGDTVKSSIRDVVYDMYANSKFSIILLAKLIHRIFFCIIRGTYYLTILKRQTKTKRSCTH